MNNCERRTHIKTGKNYFANYNCVMIDDEAWQEIVAANVPELLWQ